MALEILHVPAMQGPLPCDAAYAREGRGRRAKEHVSPYHDRLCARRARRYAPEYAARNIGMSTHETRDDMIFALAWASRIFGETKLPGLPVWQCTSGRWQVGF
jgi:hypothetical protein